MIYTASLLFFLGCSVYLWCNIVADSIFKLVGLISPSSFILIQMNANMAVKVFVVLAFVMMGLAVFESFIFSRKIAGPLFAFFRHLKKCEKKGRLEEFSLRKGDLFIELTENFNRVVRAVNSKESTKDSDAIKLQPFGLDESKPSHTTKTVLKLSNK